MGVGVPFCGGAVWNRTTPSETTVLQTAVGTSQLFRPQILELSVQRMGRAIINPGCDFSLDPCQVVQLSSCPVALLYLRCLFLKRLRPPWFPRAASSSSSGESGRPMYPPPNWRTCEWRWRAGDMRYLGAFQPPVLGHTTTGLPVSLLVWYVSWRSLSCSTRSI